MVRRAICWLFGHKLIAISFNLRLTPGNIHTMEPDSHTGTITYKCRRCKKIIL